MNTWTPCYTCCMESNICKQGHVGRMVQRKGRSEGSMRCLECARIQRKAWSDKKRAQGLNAQGKARSAKYSGDIEVRFLRHVEERLVPNIHYLASGECWLYVDSKADYPSFHDGSRTIGAHLWAYLHWVGEIPEGYQIDHLCKQTRCVRPQHLEAVTPQENTLRSNSPSALNAQKVECPKGHPYSGKNLVIDSRGARRCRECTNYIARERKRRKRLGMTVSN